jgi:hypothetical protein
MGDPKRQGVAKDPQAVVPETLDDDPGLRCRRGDPLYVPQTSFVAQANCPEIL